jgi:hypothetical protein
MHLERPRPSTIQVSFERKFRVKDYLGLYRQVTIEAGRHILEFVREKTKHNLMGAFYTTNEIVGMNFNL